MNLKTWVESEYGRAMTIAKAIDVPPSFVSKMVNGEKAVPAQHCKTICKLTNDLVTCQELRPLDWHKYWPELADQSIASLSGANFQTAGQGVRA